MTDRCGICAKTLYPRDDGPDRCSCGAESGVMFKEWQAAQTKCPEGCMMVVDEKRETGIENLKLWKGPKDIRETVELIHGIDLTGVMVVTEPEEEL